MGSGIAAHCANAGIPVLLLDIVPPDGKGGRNAFAQGALQKLRKARPAAFMAARNELLVSIGVVLIGTTSMRGARPIDRPLTMICARWLARTSICAVAGV